MSAVRIAEFDIQNDDWSRYIERLEQYFLVHNITNELKVPTLITVMGAPSYELLENLCAPDKPSTKTLEELTAIMKQHLQPKRNLLVERYNFRNRKQLNHENISAYVLALKKMSATCEFGETLDENLRDQFVCGIKSMAARQRLFAQSKLTFMQASNLAASMEVVENDTAMIVKGIVMAKAPVDSLLMVLQQQRMMQKRLQKRLRQRAGLKPAGQSNVVQEDPEKQQNL